MREAQAGLEGTHGVNGLGANAKGKGGVSGKGLGRVNGVNGLRAPEREKIDVRIPERVIDAGVNVVREELENVVEVVDDGAF